MAWIQLMYQSHSLFQNVLLNQTINVLQIIIGFRHLCSASDIQQKAYWIIDSWQWVYCGLSCAIKWNWRSNKSSNCNKKNPFNTKIKTRKVDLHTYDLFFHSLHSHEQKDCGSIWHWRLRNLSFFNSFGT